VLFLGNIMVAIPTDTCIMVTIVREEHKMRTETELRSTLVQTRQRVSYTTFGGKEKGLTYLVVGPDTDGTWLFKVVSDPSWTKVDTSGQCHNHFYDGHTRTVSPLELEALELHKEQLSQGMLF
jgi:hypothetical protein